MRTIITLLFAAGLLIADAKEDKLAQAMKTADSVVWVGIDYSLVRMIGTPHTIKVPDLLLQDMPARWNDLFLDERIEGVAASLGKRIDIDIAGITERNKGLTRGQVVLDKEMKDAVKQTHITPEDIADAVRSLKLSRKEGVGLVFLVDRLVCERKFKPKNNPKDAALSYIERAAAAHVVFFDIATREVLSVKRETRLTGSTGNFRNSWFGPIKEIDEELSQYRD